MDLDPIFLCSSDLTVRLVSHQELVLLLSFCSRLKLVLLYPRLELVILHSGLDGFELVVLQSRLELSKLCELCRPVDLWRQFGNVL